MVPFPLSPVPVSFSLILHPYWRLTRRLQQFTSWQPARIPRGTRAGGQESAPGRTCFQANQLAIYKHEQFLVYTDTITLSQKNIERKIYKAKQQIGISDPWFFVVQSMIWVLKILKTMIHVYRIHVANFVFVFFLITQSLQSHNHSQTMSQ